MGNSSYVWAIAAFTEKHVDRILEEVHFKRALELQLTKCGMVQISLLPMSLMSLKSEYRICTPSELQSSRDWNERKAESSKRERGQRELPNGVTGKYHFSSKTCSRRERENEERVSLEESVIAEGIHVKIVRTSPTGWKSRAITRKTKQVYFDQLTSVSG